MRENKLVKEILPLIAILMLVLGVFLVIGFYFIVNVFRFRLDYSYTLDDFLSLSLKELLTIENVISGGIITLVIFYVGYKVIKSVNSKM